MRKPSIRILSVLLAVALLFGMTPTLALAGPSTETIYYAGVFISYPVAGGHPVLTGLPEYDDDPFTVEAVHFFELDSSGNPVGGFLPESYSFQGNREYACQVILVPKEGYEFSETQTEGWLNSSYYMECEAVYSDGTAYFTTWLNCAPGTVTVTFDANGGPDPAPAPLQVPSGGCIWDVIRNYDPVAMPNQPYELFCGWSRDPFSTDSMNAFSFYYRIESDLTLYAIWSHCEDSVELYVELPPAALLEDDCSTPNVTVPERANYSAEPDHLYLGDENGGPPDFTSPAYLDYSWPYAVEKGRTYYSRAFVRMNCAGQLPEVQLHGGQLLYVSRLSDELIQVVYSITVPSGSSLTRAGVFIETPRAGQNAMSCHPVVTSLTPGLEMTVWGWYTDQNASGDWYEGNLVGGNTYYALVRIYGSVNYNIAYNNLDLDVYGKNARLVKMVNLANQEGVPNLVGAVVAVTIPRAYSFTVEVPNGEGGRFRMDRESEFWTTIMDFGGVEEGPITLEAKADPTHMFSMWYDGSSYEMLSRDQNYTFYLDHDVFIKASFVRKTPFEDVRAKDYFYEPVLWAIEHDPIITTGVDETHFGPKQTCTREQIVTFLWKACDAPEPQTTVNPFTDVKPTKYYYKAVLWAVENGITTGVGDGLFGVGQSCTRAQAMTFLWKSYGSPEPKSTSCQFTDVKPGKYYYKAVLWAVENGVTSGMDPTTFGTNVTCTRAQIITFLYKVYGPKG